MSGYSKNTIKNIKMQLQEIDRYISVFIRNIIKDSIKNCDSIYLKTSYKDQCYTVSLYSTETKCTITHTIPIIDFLEKIDSNKIEFYMNVIIKKMLISLTEKWNFNKKVYI